jgi:glutaredoxin 3
LQRIQFSVERCSRRSFLGATREKADIRLYTGDYCPYCVRVKRELDRLGLEYEVVQADADGREEVTRLSGQRKIPILTIGDHVLADSAHIIRELRERYAA